MTIPPIGSQFQIPDTGLVGSYLTPDALMSYCQTRLQGVDTQMNTIFAEQQRMNFESSVLGNLLGDPALKLPQDGDLDSKEKTSGKLEQTEQALYCYMAKLDPKNPTD